jgi:cytochrome P450
MRASGSVGSRIPIVPAASGPPGHTRYRKVTLPQVAAQGAELAGQIIPANSYVAAENRDPAEHQNPDAVDFHHGERHLGFGAEPHGCLGAHLARLEMRAALEVWHRRIPGYLLAPEASNTVSWPVGLADMDNLSLVFPPDGGGRASDEGGD